MGGGRLVEKTVGSMVSVTGGLGYDTDPGIYGLHIKLNVESALGLVCEVGDDSLWIKVVTEQHKGGVWVPKDRTGDIS